MIASEFVAQTLLKATGKTSSAVFGDTKYTKVLGIGNMAIDNWSNEPDVDWTSLYDPQVSLGSVTATDTFELDESIRKISDTSGDAVQIFHADGSGVTTYDIVKADTLKRYYSGQNKQNSVGTICAQIGRNLVFNHEFSSTDSEFGGTILVPAYLYPEHLSKPGDTIPVDIPSWLVVISAAEYVRNDITKQGQYPNLISEANQIMERMKADNEAQVSTVDMPWQASGQTW